MCHYHIPFLCYTFFLVITRCFPVYLDSISVSCHCEVNMLNTEFSLPFPLDLLLLSFIKAVNSFLLTQQKSCHTYLYSYTVVLPPPWNSHSWILISLQFYGFAFKVFSTPRFSLLSKVYLPWLSQVLWKWSIFLFSGRTVVIANKQTVSRRNFIPTVSSFSEQEWIGNSTCAGTWKPSISMESFCLWCST